MLLKRGSRGENVKLVQEFLKIDADGIYGKGTEAAVKAWQKENGLSADGIVGPNTFQKMGITPVEEPTGKFDEKYKDVTIQGAVFPDAPIKDNVKITLNKEMKNEYLPAMEKALSGQPRGFQLLCTIMAKHEGFYAGSRSYRTNNPGNIGNTDSGRNRSNSTLESGIELQRNYILDIVNGENAAYPMGKEKLIKPYYSPEIANNPQYGLSPYLPGYKFVFTGQLNQFVKIYSTGARGGNSYLSTIISYFKQEGITLTQESKIQDIIKMT